MNRKRLILGVAIAVALLCVTLAGVGIQWWRKNHQPKAQPRILVTELAYCNADTQPCIDSFSVDENDNMLVNLLIPETAYPDFYLTITQGSTVNRYECQPVPDLPSNVTCTGTKMFPGAALQFALRAVEDDKVLAAGTFAIIGLQLPSPASETTETPTPTETLEVFETPTEFILEIFTPIPTETPAPIDLITSYPNPTSYP